jgi:endo-1,3-1,4-beta-glycanase ExoK
MIRQSLVATLCFMTATLVPHAALGVASAEVYTSAQYRYGRLEARMRFAPGDGVVGSFFLWKIGSENPGAFWNELDFEKLGVDCHFETNAIYGNPASNNNQQHPPDTCSAYHTYAYEWTPTSVAWLVDGVEIRRDTGAIATAFAQNAASGMQFRFNVWPGDASFGGNFNPNILPVHQYIDWVQYSSYENGAFTVDWREDFNGPGLPGGWQTANWNSPKNLSRHNPGNVNIVAGHLVLSLTADNAVGAAGAMPAAPAGSGGQGGGAGSSGTAGSSGAAGTSGTAGAAGVGGIAGSANSGGSAGSAGTGGSETSAGAGGVMSLGGAGGVAGGAGSDAGAGGSGGTLPPVAGSAGSAGHGGRAGAPSQGGTTSSAAQAGALNVSGSMNSAGTGDAGPRSERPVGGGCSIEAPRPQNSNALLGVLGVSFVAFGRQIRGRWQRRQRGSQA